MTACRIDGRMDTMQDGGMTQAPFIPGSDVRAGTVISYLDAPFVVTRVEPMEPHRTLGARRIARDALGRGVIVYPSLPVRIR